MGLAGHGSSSNLQAIGALPHYGGVQGGGMLGSAPQLSGLANGLAQLGAMPAAAHLMTAPQQGSLINPAAASFVSAPQGVPAQLSQLSALQAQMSTLQLQGALPAAAAPSVLAGLQPGMQLGSLPLTLAGLNAPLNTVTSFNGQLGTVQLNGNAGIPLPGYQ